MIKILALITMLIEHIGDVFISSNLIFPIIGRLAFPLFSWGIAEGFSRTKNIKKYILRVLLIAVISQYPHYLLFKNNTFNVCFTLLIGLVILWLYKSNLNLYLRTSSIIALLFIAHVLKFEYGIYGVLTIVAFYIFKGKDYHLIIIQSGITILGIIIYDYYSIQFISILSLGVIILLEKYDFKLNKLFTYSFYPLHIIVLLVLKDFL